jgi:hypothetical protein
MYTLYLSLSLWILTTTLQAQDYATGLVFDESTYQATPSIAPSSSRSFITLPTRFTLQKYCPTPGNQGEQGSCVAWALTSARMIHYAKRWNLSEQATIDSLRFSPSFIFNQVRDYNDYNCSTGTNFFKALTLLKQQGVDQLRYHPYACNGNQPSKTSLDRAILYRIQDFARIDIASYDPIFALKRLLNEGYPIVVGMQVWKSFTRASDGKMIWSGIRDEMGGGHAMVIIGYDDNIVAGGAVLLLNSWGQKWGQGGYIWVKYEDLKKDAKEFLTLIDHPNTPAPIKPKPLTPPPPMPAPQPQVYGGRLQLIGPDKVPFPVKLNQSATRDFKIQGIGAAATYVTTNAYRTGTQFRIYLEATQASYIYLIGRGSSGNVDVIYPFNNYSAFFPFKNSVAIPNEEYYITLDENIGQEFLCVLYSREALDISALQRRIEASTRIGFAERVREALGSKLVPATEISLEAQEVKFSAKSSAGVVPIILEMSHVR